MSIELCPAAVKQLRSMGRRLPAMVNVGKGGLTEGLTRQVDRLLDQRELVKIRALDSAQMDPRHMADHFSEQTNAAVAAVVGRTVLLYRPNYELAKDKRIELP